VVKTEDYVKTFVSVHQTTKPCHTSPHEICCKHRDTQNRFLSKFSTFCLSP